MREQVVTGFGPSGEVLGRRMLETTVTYWPAPVVAYVDAISDVPVLTRLTSDIPGWLETQARLPETRPDAPTTGYDKWTRKPDNYIWNAKRFAVKAFVWLDAAERLGRGTLVWLDADTVTTAPVPNDAMSSLMDGVDMAILGRGAMHPETGFVAFRVPEALPLLRWCSNTYQDGGFMAIDSGWTDCHVLRAGLAAVPVRVRDLTSDKAIEWNSRVDAFAVSAIGPYVSHLKGQRRKAEALA